MVKKKRNEKFNTDGVIDIETARRERQQRIKQSEDTKEPSRRQAAKNIRQRVLFSLALLLVVLAIVFSSHNIVALKIERAAALSQLQSLEKEKESLKDELEKVDGREYVEQQAREQLRMILPGETLYIFKENGNEATD